MTYQLYHNPRCSKSRETLQLLQDKGVAFEVIEYLKTPPDLATLKVMAEKLQLPPLRWMRVKDALFKELGLSPDDARSDDEWLQLIAEHPALLERPVLVGEKAAALGRPPENVLTIL